MFGNIPTDKLLEILEDIQNRPSELKYMDYLWQHEITQELESRMPPKEEYDLEESDMAV